MNDEHQVIAQEDKNWQQRAAMLINRIKKNQRRFKSWLKQEQVCCYRLYNWDIPELPLMIDWYDGRLHVALIADRQLSLAETQYLTQATAAALGVMPQDCFIKIRKKKAGGLAHGEVGADQRIFEVKEGGLSFMVNLSDYLDTGLFLDHRKTRALVRAAANKKSVLNLFAYTGSFTVYAAAGGAADTTTVDLSNTYLEGAKANMRANGFTGKMHHYVKGDILSMLDEKAFERRYDLIILDPPTVSKGKAMKQTLVIGRDHVWMINQLLKTALRPGGTIYFSTNFQGFKLGADRLEATHVEDITDKTVPPDFANHRPHNTYLITR